MDYHNGFLSEFLSSSYCYDEVSAAAIIKMLDSEGLVNNVIEGSSDGVERLIVMDDEELNLYLKGNIDVLLSGVYKMCSAEDVSVLSYITKSILDSTPEGELNLLLTHSNRKEGELFESTLAGILYSNNSNPVAIQDDAAVLKKLAIILASELLLFMKQWVKSDNMHGEFHKIISKFLLSQSSINKQYILGLIEMAGVNNFFEKVRTIGDIDNDGILAHYSIKESDFIALSIENKEDVLVAVRTLTNKEHGVFFAISKELDLPQQIYSDENLSKEVQVAKMFKKGSVEDYAFWSALGLYAIKVISGKFNRFTASSLVPAPSMDV